MVLNVITVCYALVFLLLVLFLTAEMELIWQNDLSSTVLEIFSASSSTDQVLNGGTFNMQKEILFLYCGLEFCCT